MAFHCGHGNLTSTDIVFSAKLAERPGEHCNVTLAPSYKLVRPPE